MNWAVGLIRPEWPGLQDHKPDLSCLEVRVGGGDGGNKFTQCSGRPRPSPSSRWTGQSMGTIYTFDFSGQVQNQLSPSVKLELTVEITDRLHFLLSMNHTQSPGLMRIPRPYLCPKRRIGID